MRFGYRRVHVLLRREGWEINAKKTYRVYKELGMQLRNKTPKRRVKAKLREDRKEAVNPNEVWAMDFVHDQLATGRKIRILTVVDTFSRYVPVLDGSATKAKTWSSPWIRSAARPAIPRQLGSIMAANLSLVTWTVGLTNGTSRWTSQGRESRPTMPTSRRSTANSDPNA